MEDFVTYNIAEKLNEKGFDWSCSRYYSVDNKKLKKNEYWAYEERISAPTISQALKWLREKDIMVEIPPVLCDDGTWTFSFRVQTKKFYDRSIKEDYNSYELAALACIEYVLDKILR